MLCMEFRFLAGRYHATPWDHHANEGAVEWPPSPWRILRALIALWKRRRPDTDDATMRRILDALVEPPSYLLPKRGSGHSRHYVPLGGTSGKTALLLDTFLTISPDDHLLIVWPHAALQPEDWDVLADLIGEMSYLGRAESWVDGRLVPESELSESSILAQMDAVPILPESDGCDKQASEHGSAGPGRDDMEIVRLLAPMSAEEYATWRPHALEAIDRVWEEKKSIRKKAAASLPEDVFGCLLVGTSQLRAKHQGWSSPPGAKWVSYRVHRRELKASIAGRERARGELSSPTAAVFALASDTSQGDVRPLVTGGLGLAETFRQALMSWSADGESRPSPVFSGKDETGRPLTGHRHAFILPTDDDSDGYIDHVVVFAKMGFGEIERSALYSLRRLWQSKGRADLFPLLIGLGHPEDFAPNPGRTYYEPGKTFVLGRSRRWRSITPYILTRHPKKGGKDSPEEQIVRDLERMGFPAPVRIERISGRSVGARTYRWLQFTTNRRGGSGARAAQIGYGFELEFPEPVQGPISVGYAAHFGLGLFEALPD